MSLSLLLALIAFVMLAVVVGRVLYVIITTPVERPGPPRRPGAE